MCVSVYVVATRGSLPRKKNVPVNGQQGGGKMKQISQKLTFIRFVEGTKRGGGGGWGGCRECFTFILTKIIEFHLIIIMRHNNAFK